MGVGIVVLSFGSCSDFQYFIFSFSLLIFHFSFPFLLASFFLGLGFKRQSGALLQSVPIFLSICNTLC